MRSALVTGHLESTRFTELVGVQPNVYRRRAGLQTEGMSSCVAKLVTIPIRN
jgi:hypothetical protein